MGKATAVALSEEGWFIHGIYNTNCDGVESLKGIFKNIETYQCDFSDRKNTLSLIAQLRGVRFDGVVNSAGVFIDTDFRDLDISKWTGRSSKLTSMHRFC